MDGHDAEPDDAEPDDAEPHDAALMCRSLSEPEAFGVVFERHAVAILRFALRRVAPSEAEGLVADVFRIAFERRASFDVERPLLPWLYGIGANLVAKHHRAETRRLKAVLRLAARHDDSADPADDVVGSADAAGALTRVMAGLAELTDGERDVLLLYAWEDLGYEEIAVALEIPVGTVRSRLSRARDKLGRATGRESAGRQT